MPAARRTVLRFTAATTIAALLLALIGLSTWQPIVPVHAAPPGVLHDDIVANLVSEWKLDETSGSRNDTHGIYGYTPTGSVSGSAGKIDNAAAISTDANYLNAGDFDPISVDSSHDFTIAAWLYFNSQSTNQNIIISKAASASSAEFFLRYLGSLNGADYLQFAVGSDAQTVMATGTPISNGVWYFVVAWQEQGVIGIQVNNGTVYTATAATSYSYSSAGFKIGNNIGGGSISFDGLVDEVSFWKSGPGLGGAIPADVRTALYNAGAGCTSPYGECTDAPTATPTSVSLSGNVIRNWSFDVAPRVSGQNGSIWAAMNRVVQSPYSDDPLQIDDMPYGSCGRLYWLMSRAGGSDGRIYQDFGWTGGPMFINFEGLTDNYITRGKVSILNRGTGEEDELLPTFTNGSMSWQSFKYLTGNKAAGQYRIGFEYETLGPSGGLAIDNVNVRHGYWGNDCPASSYHGQMPTTTQPTLAAAASPTEPAIQPNTPLNTNCDFEQGWHAVQHNAGTRLVYTGGVTGPTYAYLFTLYGNGSDPTPTDVSGNLQMPFNWPGGQMMYASWWTGPGTRASVTIRNNFTGYVRELQSPNSAQTYNGWVKHSVGFFVPQPGAYFVDVRAPWGQIAAIDGLAVSSGGFSGPCGGSLSNGDNNATATQHIANTQVAATATNQPGVILTANQVGTNQAAAYATYLAAQYATMTQHAAASQTAGPPNTQTQRAIETSTKAAQQTATAQGTPVPSATTTPSPMPQPTGGVCVWDPETIVWVCADPPTVPAPNSATLTAIAAEATNFANAQATFWAAALATADARAQQTQSAAQTAAAGPAVVATQNAAIQQTATARAQQTANAALHATQTAIVEGLDAQATANALATQHQQQAEATATAAAQQTSIAGGGGPTQEAEATSTAQSYATQYAGVTATAQAQLTADAVGHANQTATVAAQRTANAASTAVALATQQQQQAQATQTAVALQATLATGGDATAQAQATTTAQAYATTYAQVTATAQAQATTYSATQQASGTTVPGGGDDEPPVDDRPEPGPSADCIRPDNPLALANWVDYEVCRILTWFAWTPDNGAQLDAIQYDAADRVPWGLLSEIGETIGVFGSWAVSLPWCETGFCQDVPLAPLNFEASKILMGEWDWSDGAPAYSDQCSLTLAPLLGPYIESGMCFCMNVACALGILPWIQLVFNFVMVIALLLYIRASWFTAAHT